MCSNKSYFCSGQSTQWKSEVVATGIVRKIDTEVRTRGPQLLVTAGLLCKVAWYLCCPYIKPPLVFADLVSGCHLGGLQSTSRRFVTNHISPSIVAQLHSLRGCLTLPDRSLWIEGPLA